MLTVGIMKERLLLILIIAVYGDVAAGGGNEGAAAACSADKLDIAFIIDASGSIGIQNFELVKNFVNEFIGIASMDDGTVRIGVLTFSYSVRLYAYLNSYTTARALQEVVKNISYDSSSTYTAAGLWAANNHIFVSQRGDRSDVPNVAILIADGISNINQGSTIPQANLLKETGAKIIAVGITTSNRTKDELDKLASLPLSDHRIDVDDFTKLAGLSSSILSVTCAETITPAPTTTAAPTTTTTTSTTTTPTTTTTIAATTTTNPTSSPSTSTSTTTSSTTHETNPTTEEITEIPEYTGIATGIIVVTPDGGAITTEDTTTPTVATTTTTSTSTSTTTTTATTTTTPDTTPTTTSTTTSTTSITPSTTTSTTSIATTPDTTSATTSTTTSTSISTTTTTGTTTTTPDTTPTTTSTTPSTTSTVLTTSEPLTTTPAVVPSTTPDSRVCLDNPLDIAFVIDASSSVGNDHFLLVVDYIKSVLSTSDIDGGKVRAAVVTYSTNTAVHINLNDFKTSKEMYGALDGIPYVPGWTNAAEAFQTLRLKVFTPRTGDRHNVKNVALLITDGRSNINKDRVVQEASEVKKTGTHVLAVGVGLASLEEVDNVVTSPASENRFTVAGYEDLRGLGEVLFPFLCQDRSMTGTGRDDATGVPGNIGTTPNAPKSSGSTTQGMSTTHGTQGGRHSGTAVQNTTISTTAPLGMNTRLLQCHNWCEENQEETPDVNISEIVRELILPKAMLSKQLRAKGSAFDASPVANSVGTIVFLVCSTPFFVFVGWDILDLARYLSSIAKTPFPSA
ncbi:location of vulva defective 1-like [Haliotis asinina]|uniref:location of vulva defective 1-like n=1 Tax=Haliotis asinina TaxID=109174 RepID=UPI003531C55E